MSIAFISRLKVLSGLKIFSVARHAACCMFFVVCVVLSGCSTPIDGFAYNAYVNSMDADERAIISNSVKDGSSLNEHIRICSEASPDVFSVFAAAFEASATVQPKDVVAGVSGFFSQNASTIERSQTINLIRESMYRTCERYLSGAISKDELIVQAARDQQAMIAILAIEQITGVQKAKATALTTLAQASAGNAMAVVEYSKAKTQMDQAMQAWEDKKAQNEEQTAIVYSSGSEGSTETVTVTCETLVKPGQKVIKSDESSNAKALKLQNECKTINNVKNSKVAYFNTIDAAMPTSGSTAISASGQLISEALMGQSSNLEIAEIVQEIVKINNNFDEVKMTCVVILRNLNIKNLNKIDPKKLELLNTVLKSCGKYFDALADLKIEELNDQKRKIIEKAKKEHTAIENKYRESAKVVYEKFFKNKNCLEPFYQEYSITDRYRKNLFTAEMEFDIFLSASRRAGILKEF